MKENPAALPTVGDTYVFTVRVTTTARLLEYLETSGEDNAEDAIRGEIIAGLDEIGCDAYIVIN